MAGLWKLSDELPIGSLWSVSTPALTALCSWGCKGEPFMSSVWGAEPLSFPFSPALFPMLPLFLASPSSFIVMLLLLEPFWCPPCLIAAMFRAEGTYPYRVRGSREFTDVLHPQYEKKTLQRAQGTTVRVFPLSQIFRNKFHIPKIWPRVLFKIQWACNRRLSEY